MAKINPPKILVIVGPTASGKSDLAVKLAKKYNGEIISADSRQVYRGLNIGSGKITKKEMQGIPHHLLDAASPKRQFTVAQYQKLGNAAIRKILRNHKLPIIVGGTGFYIDALVYDHKLPEVKPNIKLRKKLEKLTTEELFKRLVKLDPKRSRIIDRFNKRRLIRALEIVTITGKPVPKIVSSIKYKVLSIGIKTSDTELKTRIKKRLIKRFKQGMIAEVKKLKASGLSWQRLDNFGLEYRWISRWLVKNEKLKVKNHRMKFKDSEEYKSLLRDIVRYSKRQMTWFKRNSEIKWIITYSEASKEIKKFLLNKNCL